jgi:hypothetical protein
MASTPVEIIHGATGLTAITLKLYARGSDAIVNGAGDALTEQTNRKGVYRATVDEALTGLHEAYMVDGSGNVLYAGVVRLQDTSEVCTVGELSALNDVPDMAIGEVSITAPALPNLTAGYLTCLGTDGLAEPGVIIQAKMTRGPGTAGYAVDSGLITMTSDGTGLAQHAGFIRGATYQFRRGSGSWTIGRIAPNTDRWNLDEILGNP